MNLKQGKQYRVREHHATYTEVVEVEHVAKNGRVTITVGGFLNQGGRLDLTPKRVAELEWLPMD